MINQFQEHVYLYFYTHVNISHSISFIYDDDLYYLPYYQILYHKIKLLEINKLSLIQKRGQ